MSFEKGDYVKADIGGSTEAWVGFVEGVRPAPLGGLVITVRRSDSQVADFHEKFVQHATPPYQDIEINVTQDYLLKGLLALSASRKYLDRAQESSESPLVRVMVKNWIADFERIGRSISNLQADLARHSGSVEPPDGS